MNHYPTIDYYYQQLPKQKDSNVFYISPWQQSFEYRSRPSAILPVEKLFLPFHKESQVKEVQRMSQNGSLWHLFCQRLDLHYSMVSISYQKQNVSFFIQHLKNFMVEKEIKSLFTSRRMYPILDLLDRPMSEFTKHHRKAIGFLWTFLFHESIYVEEELFNYSKEELFSGSTHSPQEPIKILRNAKGIWFQQTDKK